MKRRDGNQKIDQSRYFNANEFKKELRKKIDEKNCGIKQLADIIGVHSTTINNMQIFGRCSRRTIVRFIENGFSFKFTDNE